MPISLCGPKENNLLAVFQTRSRPIVTALSAARAMPCLFITAISVVTARHRSFAALPDSGRSHSTEGVFAERVKRVLNGDA